MPSNKALSDVPSLNNEFLALDNQENIKLLFESAPLAMVTTDQTGTILLVNALFEEMFGYQRDELVGQPIEILLPKRLRNSHIEHRLHYTSNPRIRPMGSGLDLVAVRKDRSEFSIEVGLSFINVQNTMMIISAITDLSTRKIAKEILEQRVEERTHDLDRRRQVADGLRDILKILNSNRSSDEILNHIVAQAGRLLKADASAIYRLKDGIGPLIIQANKGLSNDYVAQANIPIGEGHIGQAVLERQVVTTSNVAHTLTEGDSETKSRRRALLALGYHAVLAVPLIIKDEVYGCLVLYYAKSHEFSTEETDLATTFGDQATLAIENARLKAQVERAAVAAERNRLARDLHDSVTQTLFSASLIAEVLPRLTQRNPEEADRRLEELRQLTRSALAEMRTLLLELRPSRLTEVGLGDLLRQLTEAITGRARVPITLEVERQCTLPPKVQVSLYRTAQEALNNVAKHAHANQAMVKLRCEPDSAELSITDNGRGFVLENLEPDSLGLSIMRERAESIGALLKIESEIGQGTSVKVVWRDKA
ncbi:MAG: PAS domain S-box protein [Ketobacter sp.]|nr:PAS domain S-box protein [Ketobacter sp.]